MSPKQVFQVIVKDMVSTKPEHILCSLSTLEKAKEFIELYLNFMKESRNYEVKIDDGEYYNVFLGNSIDFRLNIDTISIFDCADCAFKDYMDS